MCANCSSPVNYSNNSESVTHCPSAEQFILFSFLIACEQIQDQTYSKDSKKDKSLETFNQMLFDSWIWTRRRYIRTVSFLGTFFSEHQLLVVQYFQSINSKKNSWAQECNRKAAFLKVCELLRVQFESLLGAEVNKLTEKAEVYETSFVYFVNQFYLLLLTILSLALSEIKSIFRVFVTQGTEIFSGFSEDSGHIELDIDHMTAFEDLSAACQEWLLNGEKREDTKKPNKLINFLLRGGLV